MAIITFLGSQLVVICKSALKETVIRWLQRISKSTMSEIDMGTQGGVAMYVDVSGCLFA